MAKARGQKVLASRQQIPGKGKRGDRKDEILEAARRLFVAKGSDGTTMADIAAETGIAEGTVYLYFKSKRDLVAGIASYWTRQMLDRTVEQLSAVDRLTDKLTIIVQNHLTFMLQHPDLYFLFFKEIRTSPDYATSDLHEVNRAYTEPLKKCLAAATPSGRSPAGLTPSQMRDLVYGGVEHTGWARIVRGKAAETDVPALARALTMTFLAAFGLDETAPADLEARVRRLERLLGVEANE
ncbi:TetR/AcrR family transcriptional regulator [Enterovirga sp. CN4-39]|uniref:TetR/AcrR family transcriptional regulator n=1 Tax=Enterovirga sp. CN4-39 TaxID=3400910 RepID=UPI003BFF8A04